MLFLNYLIIIPRLYAFDMRYDWNNCFIKNSHKISRILPDFICKNNRFSACFQFWADAYSYHILRAWYNASYPMMAKPNRALELHYPMIQFLIKYNIWTLWNLGIGWLRQYKGRIRSHIKAVLTLNFNPRLYSFLQIIQNIFVFLGLFVWLIWNNNYVTVIEC